MGLYKNTPGNVLVPIAGRGKAEYGASTVRTGSVALEDIASHTGKAVDVVFDTPMPDNDYIVVLDALDGYSDTLSYVARDNTKGKTKFKAVVVNPTNSTVSGASLHYTAFKLYTDNEYNELIDAKIPGGGLSNYALTKSGDNNYQCQWMQVPVVLHTYTEGTAVNYKKIKLRSNSYLTLNLTLKDRIGNEWSISVTLSNVPIVRRVLKGSSDTAAITAFSYSNLTNNSVDIYFRVNSWSTVIIEALDLYGWDTTNRATEISITDSTAEEFNAASYIYPNIVPQMVGGWISDTDVDTLLEPGFYMIAQNNTNLPDTGATSDKYWGSLYVCTNKTDTGSQIFIPMSGNVFVRRMVSRSWYPWEKLAVAT